MCNDFEMFYTTQSTSTLRSKVLLTGLMTESSNYHKFSIDSHEIR